MEGFGVTPVISLFMRPNIQVGSMAFEMFKDTWFHLELLWMFWAPELPVAFSCGAGHGLGCQRKVTRPDEYNLIRMVLSTEDVNPF